MSNEFDIWNGTYLIEDRWEIDADDFTSTDPNDNTQAAVQALIDKYGNEWLVEFVIRVQDMTVTFEAFEFFLSNEGYIDISEIPPPLLAMFKKYGEDYGSTYFFDMIYEP